MMRTGLTVVILAVAAACGSAAPSEELVSARRSYQQAERSRAKELAPDRLLTAKQALGEAEAVHDDDAQSEEEKTLAYIADRLARQAIAQANILAAEKERLFAESEYKEELERTQKRTSASLGKTKSELQQAEQELQQRKKALEEREKELAKNKGELEAERKARLEAERKAAETMAKLEEFAKLRQEERGLVITLSGEVLFRSNKSSLLPLAQERLIKVAGALMQQDKSKHIVVEGHTDSKGGDGANRALSQSRADAVRVFLIQQGVPSERISAIGKG